MDEMIAISDSPSRDWIKEFAKQIIASFIMVKGTAQ